MGYTVIEDIENSGGNFKYKQICWVWDVYISS